MSGLSYVQVDKHDITILYHLHRSVGLAHQEICRAKVCKGGVILLNMLHKSCGLIIT